MKNKNHPCLDYSPVKCAFGVAGLTVSTVSPGPSVLRASRGFCEPGLL